MMFHRDAGGQSFVELALSLPMVLVLVLGLTDFSRAYYYSIEMSGAARAGVREAIISETTDIGDAVRSEPNSAILNTVQVWGPSANGGAQGDCTSGSQNCGDPNGCPASSFTGTRIACFAIRTCTLNNGNYGTCTSFGAWGSRPSAASSATKGIQVVTVFKFTPVTGAIAALPGTVNGVFYLRQVAVGNALYFP